MLNGQVDVKLGPDAKVLMDGPLVGAYPWLYNFKLREGSFQALQYTGYQTRGWAVGMRTSFHTNPPASEGWRDRDQLHYHYIIVSCYVMYPDQLQDPVICNSKYPPLHCQCQARPLARVWQSRNDKFQSQLFTHLHIGLFLGLYIAIIIIICYLVSMNQAKMSC